MKKAIVIILLALAVIVVCVCFLLHKAQVPAKEGICKLEFKAAKNSESVPSLAHQYQLPISEKLSQLKDLPKGLSQDCKYFVAKLADRDIPVILDSPENPYHSMLYVDTNADGYFSNEKSYAARPAEERGLVYRYGPVPLEFDTAESKVKTEFYVMTRRGRYLMFYPTGYQVGEIDLGRNTYKVAVIDGNFDGRYDKLFSPPVVDFYRPGCDLFAIDRNGDNILSSEHLEVMPLGRMIRVRNAYSDIYYSIDIATGGSSLGLKKVEPEFGTLDLGGAHVQFQLWSDAARQILSGPPGKNWKLPIGRYMASPIEFRHVDTSGNRWIFRSTRETGKLKNFEIRPGQTTAFKIGPPFSTKTSVEQRDRIAFVGFDLEGQSGVLYRPGARKGRTTIPEPKFKIIDEAGKVVGSGQFEYG